MAVDDRCVLTDRVSWLYRDEGVFCFSLDVSDGEGDKDDLDCETTSWDEQTLECSSISLNLKWENTTG